VVTCSLSNQDASCRECHPLSTCRNDQAVRATPPVSVLIPAWNASAYIRAAVASVLGDPEAPDLEVLVVDDGSTDATAEIVRRMAEENGRVRLIVRGENAGIAAALQLVSEAPAADDPCRASHACRRAWSMHATS
jgi:GT2 family glycosyltransferase